MVSKSLLRHLLQRADVQISYEFDLTTTPYVRLDPPQSVDLAVADSPATKVFEKSYFGDRLGIRLGPIVYSHVYERKRGRENFNGRKSVFDLTKTDNRILIMPNEGLTVSSLENITLGPSTAAIIIPRLSLATAGLVVATTYIDPYWEGILQLYIKNTTPHPYELRFGEKIAICRFYTVAGDPDTSDAQRHFAQKSHHFALNWTKILDTDTDPQPLRKKPLQDAFSDRAMASISKFVAKYWPLIVGGSFIAAAGIVGGWIVNYAKIAARLERTDKLEEAFDAMKANSATLTDDLKRLREKQVEIGRTEIVIPPGVLVGSADIAIERPWIPSDLSWVMLTASDPSISVKHSLVKDSQRQGKTLLHVELQRVKPDGNPYPLTVQWLVGSQ